MNTVSCLMFFLCNTMLKMIGAYFYPVFTCTDVLYDESFIWQVKVKRRHRFHSQKQKEQALSVAFFRYTQAQTLGVSMCQYSNPTALLEIPSDVPGQV